MKRLVLVALCALFAMNVTAQKVNQVAVAFVKSKAKHYDTVILQGKITRQVDDDEFILADNTGSIIIELEDEAEHAAYLMGPLQGATVRVFGVVDKDDWDDPVKVNVMKIRVVSGGSASGGIPDNF